MSIEVIYIGSNIYESNYLLSYIKRELLPFRDKIVSERYIESFDNQIVDILNEISKEKKTYIIYCNKYSYELVTKIISTLSNDILESGEKYIYPLQVENRYKNSYLYHLGDALLNVIEVDSFSKIVSPLIDIEYWGYLHLFTDEIIDDSIGAKILSIDGIDGFSLVTPTWIECRLSSPNPIFPKEFIPSKKIKSDNIISTIIEYLKSRAKTITMAESCTGGLLASKFTSVSGASEIFKGSFVTYSNEIKESWLGVREETLIKYGAVSSACVEEMAEGAKREADSDISIAISGIAGPTGAVEGKPVGTVYICIINGDFKKVERLNLQGDRIAIQEQTIWRVIELIIRSEEGFFDFF